MHSLKWTAVLVAALSSLAFSMPKETAAPKSWPGAAEMTATPDKFAAGCQADLDKAKAKVAELKAMKGNRDAVKALWVLDDVNLALNAAGARSDLAYQVEPDKAMRDAAEKCTQDVRSLSTAASMTRSRTLIPRSSTPTPSISTTRRSCSSSAPASIKTMPPAPRSKN